MKFPAAVLAFIFVSSNACSQQVTTYAQQATVTSAPQLSAEQRARIERSRQLTREINDLAGRIHSEADANALVDKIAEMFSDMLPPSWMTRGIRQRLAHAEYAAVSDSSQLIPEQRIADVWNEYVREIGASEEALVTPTEIHYLRDAHFATAQFSRQRGVNPSVWSTATIYAVDSEGRLAEGCRALETLRIFYDLDMLFDNLRSAREHVRRGILVSDEIQKRTENPPPQQKTTARLEIRVDNNPVRLAEARYLEQHGPDVQNFFVLGLFNELFPRRD